MSVCSEHRVEPQNRACAWVFVQNTALNHIFLACAWVFLKWWGNTRLNRTIVRVHGCFKTDRSRPSESLPLGGHYGALSPPHCNCFSYRAQGCGWRCNTLESNFAFSLWSTFAAPLQLGCGWRCNTLESNFAFSLWSTFAAPLQLIFIWITRLWLAMQH